MLTLAIVLVLCVGMVSARAMLRSPSDPKSVIKGSFLVRLNDDASMDDLDGLEALYKSASAAHETIKVTIGPKYKLLVVKNMDKKNLVVALKHPAVAYVESDAMAHTLQSCSVQTNDVPWGISRISHDTPNHNDEFTHDSDWGASATGYVIDTGIFIGHNDFGSRASYGANFVGGGDPSDGNGHGTHCASTMLGTTYGVSKSGPVKAVKVLSDGGSGSWSGVIQGIEWVTTQHTGSAGGPSVTNMSLGGGFMQSVNDAVDASSGQGVMHVVAAGNSNNNACTLTPASAPTAITVGATTITPSPATDARTSFSSYGECLDIFAPGQDIKGAWIGGPDDTRTISGTSMASPHVAGVVMKFLSDNPDATRQQVIAHLQSDGQSDIINLNCNNAACNNSPNLMLHVDC